MLCNYHNVCAVICGRTRFSPTDYTQHPLHQNIFIKHKTSSSVRHMSVPTVCFVLLISNYLHERGTAARHYRVGKIITMLRSGIICFLTLQTIYTNGERRLAGSPCNSKLLVKNHALHYNIRKR